MSTWLFSGFFAPAWWEAVLVAVFLTQVTVACVTIYLHRCQAHRALELHPLASHFFRLWLWLTTGMVTREWVAVHRRHHARVETVDDPHSPQVLGLQRVLWGGALLYARASLDEAACVRYGLGTPVDWIERNVYSRHVFAGLVLTAAADLALFGVVPGASIFLVQCLWIPFWAAGVINGVGHSRGYRNWPTADASTNIVPWGVLVGGEELHNNHHAYPTSARLSCRWFEADVGWIYIRLLTLFGLARVKHVRPVPRYAARATEVDLATLQAVVANRHHVMAHFARALRETSHKELVALRRTLPHDARVRRLLANWLTDDGARAAPRERAQVAAVIGRSWTLWTLQSMRGDLDALWQRSSATKEQLVAQLQEWCTRAESSRIPALAEFSRVLRRYA